MMEIALIPGWSTLAVVDPIPILIPIWALICPKHPLKYSIPNITHCLVLVLPLCLSVRHMGLSLFFSGREGIVSITSVLVPVTLTPQQKHTPIPILVLPMHTHFLFKLDYSVQGTHALCSITLL